MGKPITVNIKTIDGAMINVTNTEGWDNFMLSLRSLGAVVAPIGLFIPIDKILHITPAPLVMPQYADGNVTHIMGSKPPEEKPTETPPPDATQPTQ